MTLADIDHKIAMHHIHRQLNIYMHMKYDYYYIYNVFNVYIYMRIYDHILYTTTKSEFWSRSGFWGSTVYVYNIEYRYKRIRTEFGISTITILKS